MVVAAAENAPKVCPKCGGEHMVQDEDSLDTWFSSALWPFSTLGWPKDTEDYKYFYPTDVLVTGYDIIFFWVIRMVFSGYAHTGKSPFHTVLIHGLVRDDKGRKMSKSLGNGIDPLEVIDKYGADALRLMLMTGNSPGHDMRFYWERVENGRNFANKIWNASRFILMNLGDEKIEKPVREDLSIPDRWILSEINELTRDVTENMDKFELGIALGKVQDFLWDEFCDWYIEIAKTSIWKKEEDPKRANAALWVLKDVLSRGLKLLHPFMPFITEEIYTTINSDEESIMISDYPVYDENACDKEADDALGRVKELVRGVRNSRTQMNVPQNKKASVYVVCENDNIRNLFEKLKDSYKNLLMANDVFVSTSKPDIGDDAISVPCLNLVAYIPLDELVDVGKEKERLNKELGRLEKELGRSRGMLGNEKFLSKAPQAKVDEEKKKLEEYEHLYAQVKEQLEALG